MSLTKEAVRDVRQVVEELVNQVSPRPPPALVRIPIRSNTRPHPFSSGGRRQFSTRGALRATTVSASSAQWRLSGGSFMRNAKAVQGGNLAAKMWPYSAFRRPLAGGGTFSSGLYRHFVNTNARNFSTYGGSFSREAVQNMTTSLRCLFKNGTDGVMNNMKMKTNENNGSNQLLYALQNDEVLQTFNLARTESSNVQKNGCFVEFELPDLQLPIPSMSFMDSEIVDSLEKTFQEMKEQIDRVYFNIQLIFDSYGSLAIERRARSVKIHFPNSETWEVENLLIDIGVAEGIVHDNEHMHGNRDDGSYSSMSSSSDSTSTSLSSRSSTSTDVLADYLNEAVPDLISTADSASSVDSDSFRGYYPVLSNSDELLTISGSGSGSVVEISA